MNIEKAFDELREIEETASPRLSERYGQCPVCQLTAIHFRTAANGTLIACCSCGGEWPSPILMFSDWAEWIDHGPDAPPPHSARFWVDGGDPEDTGDARAELLEGLAAMRARDDELANATDGEQDGDEPIGHVRVSTHKAISDSRSGVQTAMKTTKRTITIDVPVSADVLVAGLDPRRLHPPFTAAEDTLAEAERQLEAARTDIAQRRGLVSKHSREVAARGTAAIDDYERESNALRRAEMLLPMFESHVAQSKTALAEARNRAREVAQDEARQRQVVIDAAAAQLFTALEELAELEDALVARCAQLPTAPGEGLFSIGSIRNRLIVMRVR